jgi:hypothetical protein
VNKNKIFDLTQFPTDPMCEDYRLEIMEYDEQSDDDEGNLSC